MQIKPATHDNDTRQIEDILRFWLEIPALDQASMLAKFFRWYQGGAELDQAIRQRFGHIIERALAGDLTHWERTQHGRLALIIVLDQFTRNVFRDSPRAYAGDARALALALATLDSGAYYAYSLEERLFITMPLVHAESETLLSRAETLARDIAENAAPDLRAAWRLGHERIQYYRSVIARFGRYPHRNVILGRVSSAEELQFLEEEASRQQPVFAQTQPTNSSTT